MAEQLMGKVTHYFGKAKEDLPMQSRLMTASSLLFVVATCSQQEKRIEPPLLPDQWWTEKWSKPHCRRPGEAESRLEPFAGNYDLTMTLWSDPSAKPTVIKGTSEQKMIVGGWILEVRDEYPDLSLSLIGLHFYDPIKSKYVNVGMSSKMGWLGGWCGQFDEEGRVLTYRETMQDSLTGETIHWRGVARLNERGYVYENLTAAEGDAERTTRRIVYVRRP